MKPVSKDAVYSLYIGYMENVSVLTTAPAARGLSLAHLSEHTARYVEAGLQDAPNTAKAYAGDLKRFGAWCAAHELTPLPASEIGRAHV